MTTTIDTTDAPAVDISDFAEELRTVITFAILDLDIASEPSTAA